MMDDPQNPPLRDAEPALDLDDLSTPCTNPACSHRSSDAEGRSAKVASIIRRKGAANDPNGSLFGGEGSTLLSDLAPFADQLVAIAEHLRKTAVASGSLSAAPLQSTPPVGLSSSPIPVERRPKETVQFAKRPSKEDDLTLRRQHFAEHARQSYASRRKRTAIFGNPELFGEPAWDILLDLYIAHVDNKAVSVSSACIGSAAPPTTGLRWLGVLAEHDLVLREHDPEDQRRVLVRLTETGLAAMDEYFASAIFPEDRRAASA